MRSVRRGLASSQLVQIVGRGAVAMALVAVLGLPPSIGVYAKEKPGKEAKVKAKDKSREKTNDKSTVAQNRDDTTRVASSTAATNTAILPALETAYASRTALQMLPGYTCTFTKNEQLKKGQMLRQVVSLKFRREPFSVYLKYIEPNAGREVIYVDGRNKGKLQVHEATGLAAVIGTISLFPNGGEAMKENRYPVTMIGMEKMLDVVIEEWEAIAKDPSVKVDLYPQAKIGDAECTMYEILYAVPREPLRNHKSRIYFDKKTKFPIRSEQYAFPVKQGDEPPLVEEYTYSDLKIDAPPVDADFDLKNTSYGFK